MMKSLTLFAVQQFPCFQVQTKSGQLPYLTNPLKTLTLEVAAVVITKAGSEVKA